MTDFSASRLTGVLGPTNTGKTFLAIERMLGHSSGMIGFPLRLLARENYDKVVARKGRGAVALITGEEKIVPPRAQYFICTVEAMPLDRRVEFLAIDEIQLAGDPERGHVFTDRLLHARGGEETMFLGSGTARPLLEELVPRMSMITRPRLSTLSYAGPAKISRLPRRSAIVAFSVNEVYKLAELVRRQRGGTAVVMGALSPRTRNAQVNMYQAGEVDYLIATDAIGMGLNMDVDHVAFASDVKFDGKRPRKLTPAEIGQIAGRAGRHMNNGTFGITTDMDPWDPEVTEAIENHRFDPVKAFYWRSNDLSFKTVRDLQRSLNRATDHRQLIRQRDADDLKALESLQKMPDVLERANAPARVRLLWDICQIPDFRKTMTDSHPRLLAEIFKYLTQGDEKLPNDWINQQIQRFDNTEGDIDTLVNRISFIRTWTYISHRSEWLDDADHWQQRTRKIEDGLSDALHDKLTQRFVDKRAAYLSKRLSDDGDLTAAVKADGEVVVEGHRVGHLEGLKFVPDAKETEVSKPVLTAARRILPAELERRIFALANDPNEMFAIDGVGKISWRAAPVARLVKGDAILSPKVDVIETEGMTPVQRERIAARLKAWFDWKMAEVISPLLAVRDTEITGAASGISFQVLEGLGSAPSKGLDSLARSLSDEERMSLTRLGIRFGTEHIYIPQMLKAKQVAFCGLLWSIEHDKPLEEALPKDGRVSITADEAVPAEFYAAIGYAKLGGHAIRVDMVERIAAIIRKAAREGAFGISAEMLSLAGATHETMAAILTDLGYRKKEDTEEGPTFIRRREKPARDARPKPTNKKPDRNARTSGKQDRSGKGKGKPQQQSGNRRPDKQPDPNSPFAVLKQLQIGK